MISWHEALLRLLVALLFSGIIGAERFFAGKAAGVRTHIPVGVGAGLFTIISGYALKDYSENFSLIPYPRQELMAHSSHSFGYLKAEQVRLLGELRKRAGRTPWRWWQVKSRSASWTRCESLKRPGEHNW